MLPLTRIRDICGPHDPSDLLHALQVGAEAAVAAEDLLVHNGGDGQAVEAVSERLPQLDVVTSLTFILSNIITQVFNPIIPYIHHRIHRSC